MPHKPLYDLKKTYEDNRDYGPFWQGTFPKRMWPAKSEWRDFLGYKIASRIGVPACPIAAASKGVELCSRMGFDVITYKTIRSIEQLGHPLPNLGYVQADRQLTFADIHTEILHRSQPYNSMNDLAATVSIGNASAAMSKTMPDIKRARSVIKDGQVLIVSVFGTDQEERDQAEDFAYIAQHVRDAGAQVIEANLSCPNIGKGKGILYRDPDLVYDISLRMVTQLNDTPLLIKVGVFENKELMHKVMVAAARAGVRGVTGINAVGMQVINDYGEPFFGETRKISGLCGAPIRNLAVHFVRDAQEINQREKLGLTILATGGVTLPEHFTALLDAGADVALSGTGALWDPLLASKYRDLTFACYSEQKAFVQNI